MNKTGRLIGISATAAILFCGVVLYNDINPSKDDTSSTNVTTSYSDQSQTQPKTQPKESNCLTASEAWHNYGKNTCVIFEPKKFGESKGYSFIDEKVNYKNGFVGFVAKKNLISANGLRLKYTGKKIEIYGTIEKYEGHPQIKIYSLDQIKIVD